MKDNLRSLPFALVLTLAPLAHAQATTVTVFDSATQNWSATSANSSTNGGATRFRTLRAATAA